MSLAASQGKQPVDEAEHRQHRYVAPSLRLQCGADGGDLLVHPFDEVVAHPSPHEQLVAPPGERPTDPAPPDLGVLIALGVDDVDPGRPDSDVVDVGPTA